MSAIILQFCPMDSLPNRIRELRTIKGWSQQQLAEAVSCSKMQISTLERGEQSLDLHWMRRLAPPLGVEPGDLLLSDDNPKAVRDASEFHLLELVRSMPEDLRQRFVDVGEALAGWKMTKTNGKTDAAA